MSDTFHETGERSLSPRIGSEASALTDKARDLLASGLTVEAVASARRAVEIEPQLGAAWHVLAKGLETGRDFSEALEAYEKARGLSADPSAVNLDLARLALRLSIYEVAEALLADHVNAFPDAVDARADLAHAQTRQLAFDRALQTLTEGLQADPGQPKLWSALGTLLSVQGNLAQAETFFAEALKLDPDLAEARDSLADVLLLGRGDVDHALAEGAAAAAADGDNPGVRLNQAKRLLAVGRLDEGWAQFAARLDPRRDEALRFRVAAPPWAPGYRIAGKQILLIGEEHLGEEIQFSQVVPSVAAACGRVILAVDPRWTALARRSFPKVEVVAHLRRLHKGEQQQAAILDSPHVHGGRLVDAWAPLGAVMAEFRAGIGDFAGATPYLRPDPARVAHWRKWLAGLGRGPKVGLLWRSMAVDADRARYAPPIDGLRQALVRPGMKIVSLQCGLEPFELASMREAVGVDLHEPPGLDPTNDLDDVAALTRALDVTLGPPGATTNLAAACGAKTWFLSTPMSWPMLGTGRYPWFPKARVFTATSFEDWTEAMALLGRDLAALND